MKKLNELPDKNPFKIPENYFEDVNRKIISATAGFDEGVKRVNLYNRFRPYLLIAASVSGFILISYTAIKLMKHGSTDLQVTEILYNSDIDSYINDIDIVSLEENTSSLDLNQENPEITQKEIIDYLLLENIEINDIYERL
jgi:hypothetical protein